MAVYEYQEETIELSHKIPIWSKNWDLHWEGIKNSEPIIVALDSALRYAKAYKKRYGGNLSQDRILGPAWFQWVDSVRQLLDGDTATTMERESNDNYKDNSTLFNLFNLACKEAGFDDSGNPLESNNEDNN